MASPRAGLPPALRHAVRALAGHSHYHNTRHRKAAVDARRQAGHARLAREVRSAVRVAGGCADPAANPRLARALDAARRAGLAKERLQRLLAGAPPPRPAAEAALFEGVLAGGVGLLIRASAARKAGIAGELRAALARADGRLGKALWMFEQRVALFVREGGGVAADDVACWAIERGAVDVVDTAGGVEVLCETVKDREHIKAFLLESAPALQGLLTGTREFRPRVLVDVSDDALPKVRRMFDMLDRHEEVVEYVHNANIDETGQVE